MILLILKLLVVILAMIVLVLQLKFGISRQTTNVTRSVTIRGFIGVSMMLLSLYAIVTGRLVADNMIACYMGYLLIISGLALRLWSQITLGKQNWSVGTQAPTSLVTNGPYQFLRHPMYDAYALMGIGIIAITMNILVALGWMFFWILLFQRALEECTVMDNRFSNFKGWSINKSKLFPPIYMTLHNINQ